MRFKEIIKESLWSSLRRAKQNQSNKPGDWPPTVPHTNTKVWQDTDDAVFDYITARSDTDKAWAMERLTSYGHTWKEIRQMIKLKEKELESQSAYNVNNR